MNLRRFAGKLLRSIPFLIIQFTRLMARTPPAGTPPSPDLQETLKTMQLLEAIRERAGEAGE